MIEVRQTEAYVRWIAGLKDDRARARIELRIYRLSLGNPGDIKPVGEGVSEMRVDYGPGYRIYLTQHGKALVILLCGGNKRTQSKDIANAKALARQLKG
jgi:putative addiction module killer protein